MAKSIRAISVFLASPGGLDYERSLFREEVQAYNEDSGYSDGVCFVPVGWELRASGIGRPQAQINEDLVECDFMIMMLWDRWGSPTDVGTGSYTAGVEEEYAVSADALRDPTRPMRDIAVLFKGVDPRQMSDPGPQLESVLGFRQRLEREKSLLFSVFDNELELRREIRKLLLRWTRADFDRPKSVDRTVPIARVAAANAVPSAGGKTMSSGEALKHARSLASSGRVAEAEQQYSQILATSGPPEALAEYARFLRRAGRFAQARTVAERLLRSAEREGNYELMVEALALLGVISRKEGRQGEALSYLGRARSLVTSLDLEDSNAIRIAGYALDNYGHALRRVGDLDRAVDVLVEMKNISEASVGLAYSALALRDRGLAAEVVHLANRLDEMKDHLQLWVLRASASNVDPSPLRGLLQLSHVAEELGDQASQMVWLISDEIEFHPVLAMALGESDVVVMRVPVADGAAVVGKSMADMQLDIEPGFHVLALLRRGQHLYRPRPFVSFEAGDEVIASGPHEGRQRLAELFGWKLLEDDDDDALGEPELVPLRSA